MVRGWKVLGTDTAFGTVHTILRLIKDGWEVFGGEQGEIADVVYSCQIEISPGYREECNQ